jgi:hypothetical protein
MGRMSLYVEEGLYKWLSNPAFTNKNGLIQKAIREFREKMYLFSEPDGMLKYDNLRGCGGSVLNGIIKYSFGVFPLSHLISKFIYIEDVEGDLINQIQNSQGSLEFLAFVALINQKLNLCYQIPKLENGLHKVDFIIKVIDDFSPIPRYRKLYFDINEGKVVIEEFFGGYESFIFEYLRWSFEKKVEFLGCQLKRIDELF